MTERPRLQQLKAYGVWFLAGLLIGLLPVGIRLYQAQRAGDVLQQQLQATQLEMHLASAALMARHGDYTAARDAASQFFSAARQALDVVQRRDRADSDVSVAPDARISARHPRTDAV